MMQEFVQCVKDTARKATNDMHTAVPAIITALDTGTGLVSVQPKAKFKKPNGDTIDYPIISGVPVVFPQSKNFTLAFPIKEGDGCLLVFCETALDFWLYGKESPTELHFDLTNAIAIPSLSTVAKPVMLEACNEDAAVIQSGHTKLKIKGDGVYITGNLKVYGKIESTGDTVANGVSVHNHIHGGDSGGETTPPR